MSYQILQLINSCAVFIALILSWLCMGLAQRMLTQVLNASSRQDQREEQYKRHCDLLLNRFAETETRRRKTQAMSEGDPIADIRAFKEFIASRADER